MALLAISFLEAIYKLPTSHLSYVEAADKLRRRYLTVCLEAVSKLPISYLEAPYKSPRSHLQATEKLRKSNLEDA
jgi:hypothetical protein